MLYQFTPNTKIQSAQENANWNNFSNHGRNFTMKWSFPGNLFVVQSNDVIALPDNGTITRIDILAETAPTGAAIIVDLLKSQDQGATFNTIFTVGPGTNRPQIAAGSRNGNSVTIDNPSITKLTDYFVPSITQIGSTIGGADLSIMVRGQYNLD